MKMQPDGIAQNRRHWERNHGIQPRCHFDRRLGVETLESRLPLAADFGDAPLPYAVMLVENGARHEAVGPMLGLIRTAEEDGAHSASSDGDGDDDGVVFGSIRTGQLDAVAAVTISNAPAGARLDAWIDFNGDGFWGGPGERIAFGVAVVNGTNAIAFDVPSWSLAGGRSARFRVSTAGSLSFRGPAADGEVEDYVVTIASPIASPGEFGQQNVISGSANVAVRVTAGDMDGDGDLDVVAAAIDDAIIWFENDGNQVFSSHLVSSEIDGPRAIHVADLDGDGDLDILSASRYDPRIVWHENLGNRNFAIRTISSQIRGTFSLSTADVDGDGDLDVVSASFNNHSIYWHENDGRQVFVDHQVTFRAEQAFSVFAADVDSDGDMDLLSASARDDKIAWYENDGLQQFAERTISTTADQAESVFAGDVDGDGDIDVLSGSYRDNRIAWYENDGNENFVVRTVSTSASGPREISLADFDGDGDFDVLSALSEDDAIAWYDNQGNSVFWSQLISNQARNAFGAFAADLDGDGDLDVLSASVEDDKIAWYENQNILCDTCDDTYSTQEDAPLIIGVASGVLANDAAEAGEVLTVRVAASPAHGQLSLAEDGSFVYAPDENFHGDDWFTYHLYSDRHGPRDATVRLSIAPVADAPVVTDDAYVAQFGRLTVAIPGILANDRDADGDSLLVSLESDVSHGTLQLGFDGRFQYTSVLGYAGTDTFTYRASDGAADSNLATVTITVIPPTTDFGDAPLGYPVTLAEDGARHAAVGPLLGLTRDAEEDGAHSDSSAGDGADEDGITFGTIRVGQLDAIASVFVSNAPSGARLDAWIDFNDDGVWGGPGEHIADSVALVDGENAVRFDVPSWTKSGNAFSRFRLSSAGGRNVRGSAGDGEVEDTVVPILPPLATDAEFGAANLVDTDSDSPRYIVAADIDGDGDMDIASASRFDDRIAWHENNGNGRFTSHTIDATADGANSVFAIDLDGDGDMDLLSASNYDSTIAWYENDGSESFQFRAISTNADAAIAVSAADMDGDGDIDVLSASFRDDRIVLYRNSGNQTFQAQNISINVNGANDVHAADFNGDGRLDILSVSNGDSRIYWHEATNNGNYLVQKNVATSHLAPSTVFPVDLDKDGDIDVLASSHQDGEISWHRNNGAGNFSSRFISDQFERPRVMGAADFDGDGDFDILAVDSLGDRVFWLENDGAQNFTTREVNSAAPGAYSAVAADIDGDGDLDIAYSGRDEDTVAWHQNARCSSCADRYDIDEDMMLAATEQNGVLANDGILAGEVVQVTLLSPPTNGTLELAANGAFTYRPAEHFHGTDSFVYRAESDMSPPRDSVVTIHVASVADVPVAVDDAYVTVAGIAIDTIPPPPNPVATTLLASGTAWKYLDDGSDQGTAWRSPDFSDAGWKSGVAQFGYGDGDETTVIRCGPAAPACSNGNNYITTYFRREFHIDDWARVISLSFALKRDDGAVVYLNGVELVRDNLPAGPIISTTLAPVAASDDGANFLPFNSVSRSSLVTGRNVIAVEIHQQAPTSSDVSFDFRLTAEMTPPPVPAGVLANDVNIDGVELTAVLETPPQHGGLTFNSNGSFVYTPAEGFIGVDQFTYRPITEFAAGEPGTVRINVASPSLDYGDAPPHFPTTRAENGARHDAVGPQLGVARSAEADARRSAIASGDDTDDGVTFALLQAGDIDAEATVNVQNAPQGARLDAWIDFDGDGAWGGVGEQIAASLSVNDGDNSLRFAVPSWARAGATFARFRLSTAGNLGVGGLAPDGEVEDYFVTIAAPESSSGEFGSRNVVASAISGLRSVEAADLDGDGDVDIVTASYSTGRVDWFENDGEGLYTRQLVSLSPDTDPWSVAVADVDGDGDLDVVSAEARGDAIVWHENDGKESFLRRTVGAGVDAPRRVVAADLDGDGDTDVLSASSDDDRVAWFENDGNQSFIPRIISSSADGAIDVAVADVDGDGDLDVVAAAAEGGDLIWYENAGDLVFVARPLAGDLFGVNSIALADVDADGDLDIVTSSSFNNLIAWHENNGSQLFSMRTITNEAIQARDVLVADMDGDGDLDVLSASSQDSMVAWYENDTSRSFTRHVISRSEAGALAVVAVDIDDDGDLDVLAVAAFDERIAWFENQDLVCASCADAYHIDEDTTLAVGAASGVLMNDGAMPGETLTASLASPPRRGVLTLAASGAFRYTPAEHYFGADSFTYLVTSDRREPWIVNATITVNAVPDAPHAANDVYRISAGTTLNVSIEPGGDSWLIPRSGFWKYLDNGMNQGTVWRERAFDDSAWKSGRAELGYGDGNEATIVDCGPAPGEECTVNVNPSTKYITTYFRHTFTLDDPDRVSAVAIHLRRDDGAVVYLNGVELLRDNMSSGTIGHLTPALGAASDDGQNYATFTNLDRAALVAGANVIAVEIHQDSQTSSDISFDLELVVSLEPSSGLLTNDSDSDGDLSLSAVLVEAPGHGVLNLQADGTFSYSPATGFVGIDQFVYRTSDGALQSQPALVTINVGAMNLAPVAADDRFVARSGTPLVVDRASGVLKNDSDLNGDSLKAALLAPAGRGTVSVFEDGSFHYMPPAGFVGVDTFTYRVADADGALGFATATIHVVPKTDPINGIPTSEDDAFAASAETAHSVTAPGVLANDRDPELRPIIAMAERAPWHGSLSFASDGSFSYTPLPGFTGQDSFTYRTSDGNTFSAPATVTINVVVAIPGITLPGNVQMPDSQGSTGSPGTLPTSGDLNNDGRIDRSDLAIVVAAYGSATGSAAYDAAADINGNGRVSLADAIVLRNRILGYSLPSSSNALVQRASDRVSEGRRAIESLMLTAARRSKATVDKVHSPREASLRTFGRERVHRPDSSALDSVSAALIDCALASDAGTSSSITAQRVRSIGRWDSE